MLNRLLYGSVGDQAIAGGVLARAAQEVGSRIIPYQESPIWIAEGSTRGRIYWATSLLEYLQKHDRHLVVDGGLSPDTQNRLVIDCLATRGASTVAVTQWYGVVDKERWSRGEGRRISYAGIDRRSQYLKRSW